MSHWLIGDGEMARRIRADDWASTPLGPVAGWPQSLRTAVDMVLAMPGPATVFWGPAHVQLYNDAYIAVAKDRHPALLGRPVAQGWPDAYAEIIAPMLAETAVGRAAQNTGHAIKLRLADGRLEERVFDMAWSPIRDETGRVAGTLQTLAEVTDGHRAEEALRASEQRFRSLVAAGSYAVYRMSPDWQHMYRLDGRSFLADTGSPSEGWVDTYILPEDRPVVFAAIAGAIRDKGMFELEHRVRRADGGIGWTLSRAVPILDGLGEIIEWFGAASDVTARRMAEAALIESEARLTAIFESAPVSIAMMDAEGQMILANLEAERLFPTRHMPSRDAEHGWRWQASEPDGSIVPPEQYPGVKALRGTRTVPGMEFIHNDENGRDHWVTVASVPIRNAVGRVTGAVSVFTDIDAVKRGEAALRDSEERLRQFGAASQDILWIRDAETLQWTYLTPAFETIYGLSCDEALAGDNYRGWQDLIVPEDRARAIASIDRVRAGEHVTFEYRIRRPWDGQVRWLRNTDFPMRDETGRVTRFGGIGQDVTALKTIETALTQSEGRLRALVEGVAQLVWRAVEGGGWSWASPQWTAFTGQAEDDSHGLGWLDPVHPDDRPVALAAWARAEEAGGFEAEYRIRNAATGEYRWFQSRAAPRRGVRGEVVEWFGTSTDVHQLKALQESQTIMVAELQHRTRNLIAVVQGIADDTMDETGPTEAFGAVLSDRLAALSRVQGLLSRADVEPISIAALVRLELDAFGAGASGDRVMVAGSDVWLRNSTVQTLALALHELATNARKYGALSHDRGQLTVTWSEHDELGERRLVLDWVETELEHAPDRTQPASRGGGYGRELIEQALPHALGAKTSYALTDTGLRCRIDLPSRPASTIGTTQ